MSVTVASSELWDVYPKYRIVALPNIELEYFKTRMITSISIDPFKYKIKKNSKEDDKLSVST